MNKLGLMSLLGGLCTVGYPKFILPASQITMM